MTNRLPCTGIVYENIDATIFCEGGCHYLLGGIAMCQVALMFANHTTRFADSIGNTSR